MKGFITRYPLVFAGIILWFVGIPFLIIGLLMGIHEKNFRDNAVEVQGIIETIAIDRHGDETDYDVFVAYDYDGYDYSNVRINSYSSAMYEGAEITLLVNPDNPREVETENAGIILAAVFGGMGFLITLIGLILFIISGSRNRRNKNLMETGQHVYGEIESLERDTSVTINGRHPYRIYCKYQDSKTGYIYKFKSRILDFNPNDSYKIGDQIGIYLEPGNFKHYYVDAVDKMADMTFDYT